MFRTAALAVLLCGISLSPALRADIYDDAVANPARPAEDRERDAGTQPAALMRFANVQPGQVVLDLFGGGGYFSELLAGVVGPTGEVFLHNNASYLGFAGADMVQRLAGNRLPVVAHVDAEVEALPIRSDTVDVIWISMAYHDAYWVSDGWPVTPERLFPSILRVLKPGGTVVVIDHHAPAGSGSVHAQDLHRIDVEFARADFEQHGFRFVGASSVLENPADPLTVNVFDPSIQGQTSRFVLTFTK